tara:strand:+ start:39 stop:821 length:783 start_codon:yes stop_codon:yes gene_type:complete
MAQHGGPVVIGTAAHSDKFQERMKAKYSTSPTGLFGIRTRMSKHRPIRAWVDNEYDGGGWTMVMANRRYTSGMNNLTHSDAINKDNYRTNGTDDSTNDETHLAGNFGVGDFNCWIGLKYWKELAGKKNSNKITVVQFVATSAVELNDTSNHTHRSEWYFDDFTSDWAFSGRSGQATNHVGGTTPGMFSYHAASTARNLSTFDNDVDDNSGNCSTYYNNNPWFYGSCWSGNYFAGGGHYDAPYWNGSGGGDQHAYGAVYIK